MIKAIENLVRSADATIADLSLSLVSERSSLMCFLFHSLFHDEGEIAANCVDPLQRTTVAQFRQFIEYYRRHGYQFVGPNDLLSGLKPGGRYAMATFDDGYYNNTRVLPILEEHAVPAILFISSDHVRDNRCFWWDVLYREQRARGVSPAAIRLEGLALKLLRTDEIEARLSDRFGRQAFTPRGDIDRPLSPRELRDFAACPYVHIGNHSAGHAILTNYTREEARAQIRSAQEALSAMVGTTPVAIAYPNGDHNTQVLQICLELGLKIGFTTRQRKNRLPVDRQPLALLTLGRFMFHGRRAILRQCRTCRSDLQMYSWCRDAYVSLRHRKRGDARRMGV